MNMVKLNVIGRYRRGQIAYVAGSTIEVRADEAEWLLRDAPGCFEVVPIGPRADLPPEPEAEAESEPEAEPEAEEKPAKRRPPFDRMQRGSEVEKE